MTNPSVDEYTDGNVTPAPPGTGRLSLYPKNGAFCTQTSAGVESLLVNGVQTFAGRSGTVVPLQADYDSFFLTALEGNAAYDPLGAATAAQAAAIAASQPLDADLTAIAALSTQGFGRSLLLAANAAALTAAIAVATTLLAGTMSAADKKKMDASYKDAVADGGCDPTGVADCTAQLQALQDAMTGGGVIYFPIGRYRISTTVNASNQVRWRGAQRRNSILSSSSGTADMFNVTGDSVTFEDLRFSAQSGATPTDSPSTRTAGYAVNFGSASDSSGMRSCDILFQWSGVQSSGALQFLRDLNIREYGANAINGACILINGTGDRYLSQITTDNGSNPTGFAGIRVTEAASLDLSDSNFIHCTNCLELAPPSSKTVPSIEAVNSFFDTSVNGLVVIGTAGVGSIYRSKFTNCWFGNHSGAGALLQGIAAGVAQFDGIAFANCEFLGNGTGISCPTGGGLWSAEDCKIAGNTTGISVTPGTNHYPKIRNCHIGSYGAFANNTNGIVVGAGTYKGLHIQGNDCVDNTTPLTLGAVTVANWSRYRILDNPGINPRGAVTQPAVAASTVAVTNTTGLRVTIYLKAGTLTVVTVNAVVTGQAGTTGATLTIPIALDPGGTIAITYTVAPTWIWIGN